MRTGVTPPRRPGGSGRFVTDVLVERGAVTRARLDAATAIARRERRPVERVLLEQGEIDEQQLSRAVAERFGLVHLDLSLFAVDPAATALLHPDHARYHEALPVAFADARTLLVAMADPANALAAEEIALLTGFAVRAVVAARGQLLALAGAPTTSNSAGALRLSSRLARSPL